jgi:hypothetical protein
MKTPIIMKRMINSMGFFLVLVSSPFSSEAQDNTSTSVAMEDSAAHISQNCMAAANELTWTALGLNEQQVHFMKELQLRYTKLDDPSDHQVQKGIPDTEVPRRQNMYTSAPTSTTGAGRDTKVTNEDTTGMQNSTVHGNDAGITGSTMTSSVPTVPRTAPDAPPMQLELEQILSNAQLRKWRALC